MTNEMYDKIEQSSLILVPKGENRARVSEMLQLNDTVVPEFSGRCLHASCRRQAVGAMER